jgi:hypothetical protein
VNYLDTNSNPINVGQERDMSSFTIINFLRGQMVRYHFMQNLTLDKLYRLGSIELKHHLKSNGIILCLLLL